jgi:hypothetical protein
MNLIGVDFVVVGAWNQAILQPDWLYKEFPHIISDTEEPIVSFITGMPNSFEIEYSNFHFDPCNGQLVFTLKNFDVNTLTQVKDLVLGIRERLKYTPIEAAGHNFVFNIGNADLFKYYNVEKDGEDLKNISGFSDGGILIDRDINYTFKFSDHKININYLLSENETILRINFEYASPVVDETKAMTIAAEKFIENLSRAKDIAKLLVKEG